MQWQRGSQREMRALVRESLCKPTLLMAVVSHWDDDKSYYKNYSNCCAENVLEGGMRSSLFKIKEISNPIPEFHFQGLFSRNHQGVCYTTRPHVHRCVPSTASLKVQSENKWHTNISYRGDLTQGIGDIGIGRPKE